MYQKIGTDASFGNHLDKIRRTHSGGEYVRYSCEICNKPKRYGNHARCSKIKQKLYAKGNA